MHRIPIITSVVAIGKRMKGAEMPPYTLRASVLAAFLGRVADLDGRAGRLATGTGRR